MKRINTDKFFLWLLIQQKAIALVKNKGGVKKSNPNAVRSERSPESQKKLKRKLKGEPRIHMFLK